MQKERLSKSNITALQERAKQTLYSLVTPAGIYASADDGWNGPYHSWFGRDSAITADLIWASLQYGGDRELANIALIGLNSLAEYQGKKNDKTTGEEYGKFPHEIRNTFNSVDRIQHAQGTNKLPWYIDLKDGILKNWDSVDSTPLWVFTIINLHRTLGIEIQPVVLQSIHHALEWILQNIQQYNGLVGFSGAEMQPDRQYSGLHNQGWKDSFQIYQNQDGTLASHPIKDVLVNAEAWKALKEASVLFIDDRMFSLQLNQAANNLKVQFNDKFLLPNKEYYAQAIDGHGKQLPQWSADVGMCLWANNGMECAIDSTYTDIVSSAISGSSFFNSTAGIRNYAVGTKFKQGTLYHGNANTYWPFVSALIAQGLDQFGYHDKALDVTTASLSAIHKLGSNIEMFIEASNHELLPWYHPYIDQQSAKEQAWTAAAVYFGSLFLLDNHYYSTSLNS